MSLRFRLALIGPSMSGKSREILDLIRHRNIVFSENFDRIVFATDEQTFEDKRPYLESLKETCPGLEVMPGIPNLLDLGFLYDSEKPKLLIMDDMADYIVRDKDIMSLFTVRIFSEIFVNKVINGFYITEKFSPQKYFCDFHYTKSVH